MAFLDCEQEEAVCDDGGDSGRGCGGVFQTTEPFDPENVYVESYDVKKGVVGDVALHICPKCVRASDFDWLLHEDEDDDAVSDDELEEDAELWKVAILFIRRRDSKSGGSRRNRRAEIERGKKGSNE